jgi:cytochrome c
MPQNTRRRPVLRTLVGIVALAAGLRCASAADSAGTTFVPLPECSARAQSGTPYSAEGLHGSGVEPNALLPEERKQGWRLLFDGRTLKGWSGFQREDVPPVWRVRDGALTLAKLAGDTPGKERGDLRTADVFGNFELRLQWAVAPGGNSGVFFFVREGVDQRIWRAAPEVQLLDDPRHRDGLLESHRAGALYDIYPPACNALRPPGEYNDLRLVVRSGHVEHWLNGYRVVQYELDSEDFKARLARSKFRDAPYFAKERRGHLAVQDHGDEIRFRSIRVREL